jgi:hypothetical protein
MARFANATRRCAAEGRDFTPDLRFRVINSAVKIGSHSRVWLLRGALLR